VAFQKMPERQLILVALPPKDLACMHIANEMWFVVSEKLGKSQACQGNVFIIMGDDL